MLKLLIVPTLFFSSAAFAENVKILHEGRDGSMIDSNLGPVALHGSATRHTKITYSGSTIMVTTVCLKNSMMLVAAASATYETGEGGRIYATSSSYEKVEKATLTCEASIKSVENFSGTHKTGISISSNLFNREPHNNYDLTWGIGGLGLDKVNN